MASIPEEIIAKIINDCCRSESQWKVDTSYRRYEKTDWTSWAQDSRECFSTLRSICFVSKAFKRISQPLLFSHFNQDASPDHQRLKFSRKDRRRLFLRTLLECSQLGSYVEDVNVDTTPDFVERADAPTHLQQDLIKCYRKGLSHVSSIQKDLYRDLGKGNHDAEIVLLLAVCPNIRVLNVSSSFLISEDSWLKKTIKQQWKVQSSGNSLSKSTEDRFLSEVQYLGLNSDYNHEDTLVEHVQVFLQIPKVKELLIQSAVIREAGFPRQLKPAQLSNIYIQWCHWDVEAISFMLQASPGLETLQLVVDDHYDDHSTPTDTLVFSHLGATLRQDGTSLKSLTLDPRCSRDFEYEFMEFDLLGSLKTLRRLQTLRIPLTQILRHDLGNDEDDDYGDAPLDDKRYAIERLSSIYDELRENILPESVTNLVILEAWGGSDEKCVDFRDKSTVGGKLQMTMHMCQERHDSIDHQCLT